MKNVARSTRISGLLPALFLPTTAWGHHPMDGETPQTLLTGLLSGLGHPVIDMPHLLFILAMGVLLAGMHRNPLHCILLFLGTTALGAGAQLAGLPFAGIETWVLLTILCVGLLYLIPSWKTSTVVFSLAAFAGLFHGFEYAEAIVGSRTNAIVSYFVGFTVTQGILLMGTWRLTRIVAVRMNDKVRSGGHRIAGIFVIGLAFIL